MPQSLDEKLEVLRGAISNGLQVTGLGNNLPREFCPHILGAKDGEWHVLVWQFGGLSESGLDPEGGWRCFDLANLDELASQNGEWYRGHHSGQREQTCIDDIDIAVGSELAAELRDTSTDRRPWPAVRRPRGRW